MNDRITHLHNWGSHLHSAIESGVFGRDIHLTEVRPVAGPRAGALEMRAGIGVGRLLSALNQDKTALLRQYIPWQFTGVPLAYMSGRYLRVEAGWPRGLQERKIPLNTLGKHPKDPAKWVVGRDERGTTIIASLDDRTPHYLFSGTTGSGKSIALCNAVYQFSKYPENEVILIDGKYGDTLAQVSHLSPYPLAIDHTAVRGALALALARIKERIVSKAPGMTVIAFDEFQEFVDDTKIRALFARIARQGRSGKVHLLAATQHPIVHAFGDASTRRCLVGKLALLVDDFEASKVAVGGYLPRADHLLGAGDCYTVTPGIAHRVQAAWIEPHTLAGAQAQSSYEPLSEFPDPDWEALGEQAPKESTRQPQYTRTEILHGILSAYHGEGRPAFQKRFAKKTPGSDRASRILRLCKWVWKEARGEIEEDMHATWQAQYAEA